jgi:D-hexose-6-phosphate mutarotase
MTISVVYCRILTLTEQNIHTRTKTSTCSQTRTYIFVSLTRTKKHQDVEYEEAGSVKKEEAEAVTFTGEVDRVYGPAPSQVTLEDRQGGRIVTITKDSGLQDVVVWNPWVEKAAALSDLPDDGYKEFVCIEVGAIRKPVRVEPGTTWSGSQTVLARVA